MIINKSVQYMSVNGTVFFSKGVLPNFDFSTVIRIFHISRQILFTLDLVLFTISDTKHRTTKYKINQYLLTKIIREIILHCTVKKVQ